MTKGKLKDALKGWNDLQQNEKRVTRESKEISEYNREGEKVAGLNEYREN